MKKSKNFLFSGSSYDYTKHFGPSKLT